jgi:hypothetical protein
MMQEVVMLEGWKNKERGLWKPSTTTLNWELSMYNEEGGTGIDAVQSAHKIARLRQV